MLLFTTHITNHHCSDPNTKSQARYSIPATFILFLQPFTNSDMIWKEEPLHRASSCTNIVHTLSTLSSVSRGLVGGYFLKLNSKQSLREIQSPRAG